MPTETTLLQYWLIMVKRSRFILAVAFWVFMLTCVITFTTKKVYQATTTFYYPLSSGGGLGAVGQTVFSKDQGGIASLLLPSGGAQLQNYTQGILNSRKIADMMIDRFDLLDYYHVKSREVAASRLHSSTQVQLDREGIMEISVTDPNPKKCADLANGYVDAFRDYTLTSNISIAKKHRIDVQNRIAQLAEKLRKAGQDLVAFQTAHKSADFSVNSKVMAQTLLQLQITKMSAEMALETNRRVIEHLTGFTESRLSAAQKDPLLTPDLIDPVLAGLKNQLSQAYVAYSQANVTEKPDNPELQSYKAQVRDLESAIRRQVRRQMHVQATPYSDDLLGYQMNSREIEAKIQALGDSIHRVEKGFAYYPQAGLAYLQKARRLKILESIDTYLSTEYEKARLDEAKEAPDFQVLDTAIPPEFPMGQRRIVKLFTGLLLGLFLGITGAFVLESFTQSQIPSPETDGHPRREVTVEIGGERKS